jgi:hypothetical protein
MDRKRIRKEMSELIDDLGQYATVLRNGDQSLPKEKLEQLVQSIARLNEKAIALRLLEEAAATGELGAMKGTKEEKEPELIRRVPEAKKQEIVQPPRAEDIPQVAVPVPETKPATATTEDKSKTTQQPGMDLFSGEVPVVKKAETKEKSKQKQEDKSLAGKLQKKPIPDLKSAIGINEKFQFINELFDGNMTEYNIAINQVNICATREEADLYLDTLRDLYKWKTDNEAVIAFTELVERRFL